MWFKAASISAARDELSSTPMRTSVARWVSTRMLSTMRALTRAPTAPRSTMSRMRTPMSRAATPLRWARDFTSAATTAKLRPASPARAASTVALSARIVVCAAIWSTVATNFATSRLAVWMESTAACSSPAEVERWPVTLLISALVSLMAFMAADISVVLAAAVVVALRASRASFSACWLCSAVLLAISARPARVVRVSRRAPLCSPAPCDTAALTVLSATAWLETWRVLSWMKVVTPRSRLVLNQMIQPATSALTSTAVMRLFRMPASALDTAAMMPTAAWSLLRLPTMTSSRAALMSFSNAPSRRLTFNSIASWVLPSPLSFRSWLMTPA